MQVLHVPHVFLVADVQTGILIKASNWFQSRLMLFFWHFWEQLLTGFPTSISLPASWFCVVVISMSRSSLPVLSLTTSAFRYLNRRVLSRVEHSSNKMVMTGPLVWNKVRNISNTGVTEVRKANWEKIFLSFRPWQFFSVSFIVFKILPLCVWLHGFWHLDNGVL